MVASPGIFVHQWNIRLKQIPDLLYVSPTIRSQKNTDKTKKISVGSTIYGVVIMLLKCGILLHWSRIFVPKSFPRNGFWWTCYITMAVNVLFYVICTFIEIFGCTPREKLWNIMLEGKCLDMPKIMIASAFINFFSDLIIFILPHRVIWNLRMSREKKFGIGALFTIRILYVLPRNSFSIADYVIKCHGLRWMSHQKHLRLFQQSRCHLHDFQRRFMVHRRNDSRVSSSLSTNDAEIVQRFSLDRKTRLHYQVGYKIQLWCFQKHFCQSK